MAYQFPLNGGRINASIGGNSTSAGAGYGLISTGTLGLIGGNNITLSQNGNNITISGGAGGGGGGAALSAGTQSVSSGTVNFANSNGVSFGMSGSNQITASHNGITSQSVQSIGGYASGNTTGQSSASTFDARSLSFNGAGGISVGFSSSMMQISAPVQSSLSQTGALSISRNGNTISIGVPAVSMGMSNLGNTSGTSGTVSNQLLFAGGNNITLSQATGAGGNTISIIGGAGGGGGGVAIVGGGATYSSGSLNLNASGAMTIASTTGTALNLSVPGTSSLVGTGAISISRNGATISIGAPTAAGASIARWEFPNQGFNTINTIATNSLSMQHIQVPFSLTASSVRLAVLMSISSLSNTGTTGSFALSMNVGVYSLNGSTLSSVGTGSAFTSFSYSSGNYVTASYNGVREMVAPLSMNITPGDYWIGAILRSAVTSGTVQNLTVMGMASSNYHASGSIGVMGAAIGASARDVYMGQGIYGSTTTGMPAAIPLSSINNTAASYLQRVAFYHALYSATY